MKPYRNKPKLESINYKALKDSKERGFEFVQIEGISKFLSRRGCVSDTDSVGFRKFIEDFVQGELDAEYGKGEKIAKATKVQFRSNQTKSIEASCQAPAPSTSFINKDGHECSVSVNESGPAALVHIDFPQPMELTPYVRHWLFPPIDGGNEADIPRKEDFILERSLNFWTPLRDDQVANPLIVMHASTCQEGQRKEVWLNYESVTNLHKGIAIDAGYNSEMRAEDYVYRKNSWFYIENMKRTQALVFDSFNTPHASAMHLSLKDRSLHQRHPAHSAKAQCRSSCLHIAPPPPPQ